jgi:hypothetical protein|nr:MAG TPA: hypothetical protein [Caudoviricetes sp.]
MKVENIVTSIELSKELIAAGVSAETALCWVRNQAGDYQVEIHDDFCDDRSLDPVPCYTTSELGVMLGDYVSNICRHDFGVHRYELSYANDWIKGGEYDTEVEARGQLLLYLIKIGQITAEEANRRIFKLSIIRKMNCSHLEKENEVIEIAIANFENIGKIAERLTSGNVSHHGATIKGIAHRNAEYLKKYLLKQDMYNPQNELCTFIKRKV